MRLNATFASAPGDRADLPRRPRGVPRPAPPRHRRAAAGGHGTGETVRGP
ncbi:hypothetical protein AB0L67_01115 [Streptomyces flaveolus]